MLPRESPPLQTASRSVQSLLQGSPVCRNRQRVTPRANGFVRYLPLYIHASFDPVKKAALTTCWCFYIHRTAKVPNAFQWRGPPTKIASSPWRSSLHRIHGCLSLSDSAAFPNGISIGSAVFAAFAGLTDVCDTQTGRPRYSVCSSRLLSQQQQQQCKLNCMEYLQFLVITYFVPDIGAWNIAISMSLSVCLSVRSHISKTACPDVMKFSVTVFRAFLWR